MLRRANKGDVSAISSLLATAALPTVSVFEHLDTFVVAESSDSLVGVGGLEVYGTAALLRSLAVVASQRGRGVATALCDRLEEEAKCRGVQTLYLLTETAADFFAKRGYVVLPRDAAPREIATCEEFSRLCPRSAVFMWRAAQRGVAADAASARPQRAW